MKEDFTYPQMLLRNYQKWGDTKVSMRKKKLGIWNEYTWKDCYEQIKWLCLGLISIGLEPGDKVCILGDNDPQWFWGMLATQAAGGVAVGIYPDCLLSELKYYMEHADIKFAIVKDQEQVDKVLQIKNGLPLLRKVVYWDPDGMRNYKDPILIFYPELLELGKKHEDSYLGLFEKVVNAGKSEDIGNLFYTSGTTGLPMAAMFSYRALCSIYSYAFRSAFTNKNCRNHISFIPAAGILESVQSLGANLCDGMIINFPEKLETVWADLREIGPDFVTFSLSQWQSILFQTVAKINDAGFLTRFIWKMACRIGYKMVDIRSTGKIPNSLWRNCFGFADRMIFKRVKDNFGLRKAKIAFIADGAGNPDIIKFFNAIGLSLRALYGGTEFGIVAAHQNGDTRFEAVGKVFPEMQIRISDEGEILVRSDRLFSGYFKDSNATEVKMKGGWFHTGDAGNIDDDKYLIFRGRLSEFRELPSGIRYNPQLIESRLRFSPYISNCIILGRNERDYLSAIICLDFGNVGKWAGDQGISYTSLADLSQKDEVAELILKDIYRVKELMPEATRLKKFVLLHKEFEADGAELTRTKKLRRTFIEEQYANIIDAIYDNTEEVVAEARGTDEGEVTIGMKTNIKIRRNA